MKIKNILLFFLSLMPLFSCSTGETNNTYYQDIVGTWYGTMVYTNGNGHQVSQKITMTFNSDRTGEWFSEGRRVQYAFFTYRIIGNEIKCVGAYANNAGSVNEDWSCTCQYDGKYIINGMFTMGREEVIVDKNGNILIDNN